MFQNVLEYENPFRDAATLSMSLASWTVRRYDRPCVCAWRISKRVFIFWNILEHYRIVPSGLNMLEYSNCAALF